MSSLVNPAGYLRGLREQLGVTTNLPRDPEDLYDPADDLPWTMAEITEESAGPGVPADSPDKPGE